MDSNATVGVDKAVDSGVGEGVMSDSAAIAESPSRGSGGGAGDGGCDGGGENEREGVGEGEGADAREGRAEGDAEGETGGNREKERRGEAAVGEGGGGETERERGGGDNRCEGGRGGAAIAVARRRQKRIIATGGHSGGAGAALGVTATTPPTAANKDNIRAMATAVKSRLKTLPKVSASKIETMKPQQVQPTETAASMRLVVPVPPLDIASMRQEQSRSFVSTNFSGDRSFTADTVIVEKVASGANSRLATDKADTDRSSANSQPDNHRRTGAALAAARSLVRINRAKSDTRVGGVCRDNVDGKTMVEKMGAQVIQKLHGRKKASGPKVTKRDGPSAKLGHCLLGLCHCSRAEKVMKPRVVMPPTLPERMALQIDRHVKARQLEEFASMPQAQSVPAQPPRLGFSGSSPTQVKGCSRNRPKRTSSSQAQCDEKSALLPQTPRAAQKNLHTLAAETQMERHVQETTQVLAAAAATVPQNHIEGDMTPSATLTKQPFAPGAMPSAAIGPAAAVPVAAATEAAQNLVKSEEPPSTTLSPATAAETATLAATQLATPSAATELPTEVRRIRSRARNHRQ
eukprot:TRINITY_DN3425_c0_g1_i5.p1 TRINITY_DN3425_c0_g1~~TRINITY_DN3425_c0_g1_i5.p1  ORF type:complete len:667 (+),score=117.58 TRINITY_DN3425_c0_g1_i5:275-2002(+)